MLLKSQREYDDPKEDTEPAERRGDREEIVPPEGPDNDAKDGVEDGPKEDIEDAKDEQRGAQGDEERDEQGDSSSSSSRPLA